LTCIYPDSASAPQPPRLDDGFSDKLLACNITIIIIVIVILHHQNPLTSIPLSAIQRFTVRNVPVPVLVDQIYRHFLLQGSSSGYGKNVEQHQISLTKGSCIFLKSYQIQDWGQKNGNCVVLFASGPPGDI